MLHFCRHPIHTRGVERFAIKRRITTAAGVRYEAVDQQTWLAVRMMRIPESGTSDVLDATVYEKLRPILSTIRHIHIAPIIELDEDADGVYAAYAQLDGETLIDWLRMHGVMTVPDAMTVARSCLTGLQELHEHKVLHGDVSPSRILISRDATLAIQVTMIEPGLALLVKSGRGETPGTPMVGRDVSFTAPEVIQREVINTRSDLYSLGVTLYYCLTGYLPFNGENAGDIALAHVSSAATPIDQYRNDLPKPLSDLIMLLMSRDHRQRPHSASDALELLENSTPRVTVVASPLVPVALSRPMAMAPSTKPAVLTIPPAFASKSNTTNLWPWLTAGAIALITVIAVVVYKQKPTAVPTAPVVVAAAQEEFPKARFVRIESRNGKPLSLAEVEVFVKGTNVALKQPAKQSSTDFGGDAKRANDGNTNGIYDQDSISHTKGNEETAWWECDLGQEKALEMIRIWNRKEKLDTENLRGRIDGFQLVLLNAARAEVFRSDPTRGPDLSVEFSLKQQRTPSSER